MSEKMLGMILEKLDGMQQDITGMKQDMSDMQQDILGMNKEISGMKLEIAGINKRLDSIEAKQHLVYEHTGNLTERHHAIMSRLDEVATKGEAYGILECAK